MTKQLNGDLGASYDSVDLFGLDSFGEPAGIDAFWGTLVGTGVGTLTALSVDQWTDMEQYAELLGLGSTVLVGGAMLVSEKTRWAGWATVAAGVMNNGLRAGAQFFSRKMQAQIAAGKLIKAAQDVQKAAADAGTGIVMPEQVPGFAGVTMEHVAALNGGSKKNNGMPTLMAPGQTPHILGAPALAAGAGAWGSTHFNK